MINVIENTKDASLIIHLGDYSRDAHFVSSLFENIPFRTIKGNNDYLQSDPEEMLLNISGRKIFLAHGHKYGVKLSLEKIKKHAKELNVDILLFGHTHIPLCEKSNSLNIMNPGSASKWHARNATYGIIELTGNSIETKIRTI